MSNYSIGLLLLAALFGLFGWLIASTDPHVPLLAVRRPRKHRKENEGTHILGSERLTTIPKNLLGICAR